MRTPPNQDTISGPKGVHIRGVPLYVSAHNAGNHFQWHKKEAEFYLFLAICVGISLDLAGILKANNNMHLSLFPDSWFLS